MDTHNRFQDFQDSGAKATFKREMLVSRQEQFIWNEILAKAGIPPGAKLIVIIDDEPKIRILFSRTLERAGYNTVTFGDNASAIHYLNDRNRLIDLIVLDLNMPRVEGRTFNDLLKRRHPRTKVLIASNYAMDLQRSMVNGADGYYDKSEGIRVLKSKVRDILKH